MSKRLISANASEILKMDGKALKQSIAASEGRVVLSENVVCRETFIGDITNAEISRAFGADLILLNLFDVFNPVVWGLDCSSETIVDNLHKLVGCPIGLNLEPVDLEAKMSETRLEISKGRQASKETYQQIEKMGFDFVCLTGNPGTGVTNAQIIGAIKEAKKYFSGLIIAGKMHGAGVAEPVVDKEATKAFIDAGADVILFPAVGTVPGFSDAELKEAVDLVHQANALAMSAIGTSQESSDISTIKEIAIRNKVCGVDIQHIGDAGFGGLAPVENIFELSKAIRGLRHTVSRVARSINR